MKNAVCYDFQTPPRVIKIISETRVDDDYIRTDAGLINVDVIYPIDMKPELELVHADLTRRRTELGNYTFKCINDMSTLRRRIHKEAQNA